MMLCGMNIYCSAEMVMFNAGLPLMIVFKQVIGRTDLVRKPVGQPQATHCK